MLGFSRPKLMVENYHWVGEWRRTMIRNMIEAVFWCMTIAVMAGLYLDAVSKVQTETVVASQETPTQLVLNE